MSTPTDLTIAHADLDRKFSESLHEDKGSINVNDEAFVPNPDLEKK
jgi:hypothetical protein